MRNRYAAQARPCLSRPVGVRVKSESYEVSPTAARHLRLQATGLGTPASDESTRFRLLLAGIGIK